MNCNVNAIYGLLVTFCLPSFSSVKNGVARGPVSQAIYQNLNRFDLAIAAHPFLHEDRNKALANGLHFALIG